MGSQGIETIHFTPTQVSPKPDALAIQVERRIFLIRGHKIMLDYDLTGKRGVNVPAVQIGRLHRPGGSGSGELKVSWRKSGIAWMAGLL